MDQALITLVSVTITAFVTWSIAQRRIAVENVTKERAKWRDQIRNLASQIYDELLFHKNNERQIKNLKMQLSVLLDPCDEHDQQILCSIKTDSVEDFETEVKLMLKQDWERSKLEAGFFLCRWFLCVRRSEKCDFKKCEDKKCYRKKCYRKKCEDKKWYRKMCDFKWCRKYKIRWFPLSCSLVMLFATGDFHCFNMQLYVLL